MSPTPVTRQSLLLKIRDAGDAAAWRQFVEIYLPLIHAYSVHRGLQDADAADVAQQVLQSVARAIPEFDYNSAQGSFRGWLLTITRNQLYDWFRRAARQPAGSGDSGVQAALHQAADDRSEEELWNLEHQRRLFQWASERAAGEFQPTTWQAFYRTAVAGESASAVADSLQISVGAVYIAKSRVTARLRELVQSVENL
ncbi:MAG: sigma-70 family RNA polymerase sigma factor [Pirellulales bacterium]